MKFLNSIFTFPSYLFQNFGHFLEISVGMVWNWPVALLCLLGCIYFTFRLGFIQFKCFPHALSLVSGKYDNPEEKGQITHFQALSAALSATIGLGNIAGVAIAIGLGGPGAIFWMWIIGLFGMATKYTECTLGTHYREIEKDSDVVHGGPMYYITKGLGLKFKPLALFYAIAICLASFGAAALFQSNQAAAALHEYYHVPKLLTGVILFILACTVIIGGIKRIGNVASKIVPGMCVVYIGCALLICILNLHLIPSAIQIILSDAFSGQAAAGGLIPVILAGIRRAIFSNEAGLGSAAIAHAAVKTDYPVREGIVASLGPLIDTIIVCTATALVIILSGNYGTHMYQSSNSYTKSFEHPLYEQQLTRHVSVVQKDDLPLDSDPFRSHISGDKALLISGTPSEVPPFSVFNIKNTDNVLRFSYFKKKGDMSLKILSKTHGLLGEVDSDSVFSNKNITIEHFNKSGLWQSAIIHIHGDLPKEDITLQFSANSHDTQWYIDTIEPVRKLSGIALTTASFDHFFKGFGSVFITFSVLFFAFSTIITWSYYGETASHFLFGKKSILYYKFLFVVLIIVGSVQPLTNVINFSDLMIGLLVVPNMIALFLLSGKVSHWTKDYFKKLNAGEIKVYK
ncbi:hypothetical protein DID78_02615 [Candidatus Marinamargulisbacteria bacterium SCGC AG-343-D04]|nr:hypothetical protein DID78_02615 [Candidatus Marinamargulisbacteria bacterium SCGC AG-343-D04]